MTELGFKIKTSDNEYIFSLKGVTFQYFATFIRIFREIYDNEIQFNSFLIDYMTPPIYSHSIVPSHNCLPIMLDFTSQQYKNNWLNGINYDPPIMMFNDFLKVFSSFPLFLKIKQIPYKLFDVFPYVFHGSIKHCLPIYISSFDGSKIILKKREINNFREIEQWQLLYKQKYQILCNEKNDLIYTHNNKNSYTILPYVHGSTLKQYLKEKKFTPDIGMKVISELKRSTSLQQNQQAIKSNSCWFHGDLNCANILITEKGNVLFIDYEMESNHFEYEAYDDLLKKMGITSNQANNHKMFPYNISSHKRKNSFNPSRTKNIENYSYKTNMSRQRGSSLYSNTPQISTSQVLKEIKKKQEEKIKKETKKSIENLIQQQKSFYDDD